MHPVIDTHTHLYDPVFDQDRSEVIQRAMSAGVKKVVTVSETIEDARINLALADKFSKLIPAAGLYPAHMDLNAAGDMIEFIQINHQKLGAIGEVGLDFWLARDEAGRDIQRQIFESFVDLSIQLDLPLNVHSRSAGRHAVELLLRKNARKVQLHAFDAKASAALPAVEAGWFFSVPPSVQRSRQKQKLLHHLPLSCLLVETDSPVLGPDPAKRNEPSNALISLEWIARIKKVSLEEASEAIYKNTLRLYGPCVNCTGYYEL
jgi:TatD DNase family protein